MRRLAQMIFILGPAVLTIILAIFRYTSSPGPQIGRALLRSLLAVIIWHSALLYKHRDSAGYLVYAVFNIFLLFVMLAGEVSLP
jgi:hypothetical protein